jgi:tRNA(fMet)-specific endonuclease VapC
VRFLLDTNAVIDLLRGNERLRARVRQHMPDDFAIPAVAAHELFYGAYRSQRRTENLARLESLRLLVLEFDKEDARQAGEIRAMLAAAGTPIGPYDVLIAGQARARGLVLVTHNTGEFQRVSGLQVEDWQS